MKIIQSFVVFVALLVASTAGAQDRLVTRSELQNYLGTKAAPIAGNAVEADRTFTVKLDNRSISAIGFMYPMLTLFFEFTHSAATAVGLTCYASNDGGTTDYVMQSCTVATGTCTLNDATWTKAVSGDKDWAVRVNTTGFPGTMTCIASFTNGGASDSLWVSGILSTK